MGHAGKREAEIRSRRDGNWGELRNKNRVLCCMLNEECREEAVSTANKVSAASKTQYLI